MMLLHRWRQRLPRPLPPPVQDARAQKPIEPEVAASGHVPSPTSGGPAAGNGQDPPQLVTATAVAGTDVVTDEDFQAAAVDQAAASGLDHDLPQPGSGDAAAPAAQVEATDADATLLEDDEDL